MLVRRSLPVGLYVSTLRSCGGRLRVAEPSQSDWLVLAGARGFNGRPPGDIGWRLTVKDRSTRGRGVVLGVLVSEGLGVS
jgi:hypothetical protein